MNATTGCPECGAEVRFTTPGSVLSVCAYCHSVVAKRGVDYTKLGKVAQLAELPSSLRLGLRGSAHGGFTVVGRLQLDHGAGAWNEWYLALDNGRWLWLAEAQGRYYLSMPLGVVEGMPSFEDLRVGRTVRLPVPGEGDKTLRAVEVHTARLVSAEGELPFEVVPGEPVRYADLSGPKGSFGTLDYGAPDTAEVSAYVGNQIRLDSLQIDQGSMEPPPPRPAKAGKRLSCPKCDGALELRAPDQTMRVTCPYCRTLVDVSGEPLKALITLFKPGDELKPILALGATGTLRGRAYTVLGRIRRTIGRVGGSFWDEYLLWTGEPSDSAFHYLIVSGGHFTLAEPINYGDVNGIGDSLYYDRTAFRLVEKCTTRVTYVDGEFPWTIELDEQVSVEDYATSGELLSIEKTTGQRQEITATLGRYLDGKEVFAGFNLPGRPPRHEYVAPHEPNPYALRLARQGAIFAWAAFLLFGLLGWSCARDGSGKHTFNLKTVPGVEAAAEHILISEPIDLGQKGQQFAVEAKLRSEVDNSWVAAEVSLINEETGHVFSAPLEAAYYHGYSDGESWSEGSRSVDNVIPMVPGGRYVVRIEPAWPVGKTCTYSADCDIGYSCESSRCVKPCGTETPTSDPESLANVRARLGLVARRFTSNCATGQECLNGACVLSAVDLSVTLSYPTARVGYAFLILFLMGLVPLWNWIRLRQFEARRAEDN